MILGGCGGRRKTRISRGRVENLYVKCAVKWIGYRECGGKSVRPLLDIAIKNLIDFETKMEMPYVIDPKHAGGVVQKTSFFMKISNFHENFQKFDPSI